MKISQSLIKEVQKPNHCPKQIYYSFIEGKDLIDPSENMLLGRYFESELLGACRGGEKQEARFNKNGSKSKPFQDCDGLVEFAKDVFKKLNLSINDVQVDLESETLKGAYDLISEDLEGDGLANYDVKWTATKSDDVWNGWGDPESKTDAIIQACHYTLIAHEKYGEWRPFYFLVFGKDYWVKVIRFQITNETMEIHKDRIAFTVSRIKEYASNKYKGNGDFNKCYSCPFKDICEDKTDKIKIETAIV